MTLEIAPQKELLMAVISLESFLFKVGRVRVERTYDHLIRVTDATGLPYAPCCFSIVSYRLTTVKTFRSFVGTLVHLVFD